MFKTRKLLLIDGIGAMISATFLGFLLPTIHPLIGLPKVSLSVLAAIAMIYAGFSFASYAFSGDKWKLSLRIIAAANVSYCLLTLALVSANFEMVQPIGLTYFLVETFLIVILVFLEFQVALSK